MTLITYVYDGLFKGGIIVMTAEMSAEGGYPVGESITFGFMMTLEYGITWIIQFTMAMLAFPLLEDDEVRQKKDQYIPFYVVLVGIYGFMTMASMYITYKHEPVLHRYIEDKVSPIEEDMEDEEDEENDKLKDANTTGDSFMMAGGDNGKVKKY